MIPPRITPVVLIGWLLCATTGVPARSPDPPEAPQPEKWARVESNSPMFRLRNDRPDTPSPPEVDGPELPDPPRVEPGSAKQPVDRDSKQDSQSDTSPGESTPSTDREASSSQTSDTSNRPPSDGGGQKTSTRSGAETKQEDPRTERDPEPDPGKAPPLPSRRENRYTTGEPLQPVRSAGYDTRVFSDSLAAAPGPMPVDDGSDVPPDDPIPEWWLLGGAGLLLVGLGGVFVWMRRPRVRVVESDSLDTYEYFQKKFEAARPSTGHGGGNESRTGSPAGRREVVTPGTPPETDPSAGGVKPWELGDDQLRRAGIDPSYRPLLKQFFGEGRGPGEIARNLDMGEGEVGLVLDLARRNFSRDHPVRGASSNGQPSPSPKT